MIGGVIGGISDVSSPPIITAEPPTKKDANNNPLAGNHASRRRSPVTRPHGNITVGKLFVAVLRNSESGNGLKRKIQRTKDRDSNKHNHAPFVIRCRGDAAVASSCFIVSSRLSNMIGLLTSETVLPITDEHNSAAVAPLGNRNFLF